MFSLYIWTYTINSLYCYKSDCTTHCVFPKSLPNQKYRIYFYSNPHNDLCSANLETTNTNWVADTNFCVANLSVLVAVFKKWKTGLGSAGSNTRLEECLFKEIEFRGDCLACWGTAWLFYSLNPFFFLFFVQRHATDCAATDIKITW
jgi:hypothetical protein